MFQVGDMVCYGTAGACRIASHEARRYGDKVQNCFVLKPVFDKSMTICVPDGNPVLMERMHPVMTKEEILALIRELPGEILFKGSFNISCHFPYKQSKVRKQRRLGNARYGSIGQHGAVLIEKCDNMIFGFSKMGNIGYISADKVFRSLFGQTIQSNLTDCGFPVDIGAIGGKRAIHPDIQVVAG